MFRADRRAEREAGPNELTALREEMRARGEPVVELVSGMVTDVALPEERLREALDSSAARAAAYVPDPLGRIEAREAIAAWYAARGVPIGPDRVVVTPGTSVSYLYAFAVLCEPGDEVLVPQPSYPLFDEIARISAARLVPYRLRERDGWRIDLEHLESQISTRTCAAVLVSPHHPTGAVATPEEVGGLAEIARRHALAIVADEVFSELLFTAAPLPRAARSGAPLVLTLNGFSKMFALPGFKIGWIAVTGDEALALDATWMLAHVSDAFLPVNDRAQCAVPEVFESARELPRALREALQARRDLALARLAIPGATEIVPPCGGVHLTMRLLGPGNDERRITLELLGEDRVLVHPGHYYDLAPDHLVLSFAASESVLAPAFARIARRVTRSRD